MEKLYGLYGGKILSYDSVKKTVQISVEPYTTGAEKGITAKLAYPVGFDDQDTELLINEQSDVWVFFEKGEFKNPVVAFFRTRQSSSVSDVFRIRQKRIEFHADEILFNGKTQTTQLATFDVDAVAAGVSVVKHGHGNVKNGEGVTSQPIPSDSAGGSSNGPGSSSGHDNTSGSGNEEETPSDNPEENTETPSPGENTNSGQNGKNGKDGLSAYELAVKEGFKGSLNEYLESLKGKDGQDGKAGESFLQLAIAAGIATDLLSLFAYFKGGKGEAGKNGLSAYQSAALAGFPGSVDEWLASLHGQDALIDVYAENAELKTGKLKVWSSTVDANNTWACDYSKAGFTQKPALWANGIPLNSTPIFTSIDTANATKTNCSGFAFSSGLDIEKGCLASVQCQVNVYAIGI